MSIEITPEYDDFFRSTRIDVMPTTKMAVEALLEQGRKIATAVIITGTGTLIAVNPAHAEALAKNVDDIVQGFNLSTEIKSFAIGAGIGIFKEFIENPKEFMTTVTRFKDGHKLMEIIGNVICGGIVGLTVSDYAVLITNKESIILTPTTQKQLALESMLSVPSIFAIILTTDRIKDWIRNTPGVITDAVTNKISEIKKSHSFQNSILELEQAIKHANTNAQSRSVQYQRTAAIEKLAEKFDLPVYRVGKTGERTEIDWEYIRNLKKQMGPDNRLSLEEAEKILNR